METFVGVRKLDRLGRLTIPASTRKKLNMRELDVIVGEIENGSYVIRKSKGGEKGHKIDKLGRITILAYVRELLDVGYKDSLKVVINGESIILSKFNRNCLICYEPSEIIEYKGKSICLSCVKGMNEKIKY